MKTITQTIDININNQLCIKDNLFFDIETTGFSRTGCFCYLIGVSFTDGRHFTVIQWLAEGASDEPLLIHKFCELAENFSSILFSHTRSLRCPCAMCPYSWATVKLTI